MMKLLADLKNKFPKFEIVFHLVSGKTVTYFSEDGKIDLINTGDFISFEKSGSTIIILMKNIENIEFNPIY